MTDREQRMREILEEFADNIWLKGACEKSTTEKDFEKVISALAELDNGLGVCDVCFTSSWAPCPKETPNAQQIKGKDQWVMCQMCEADRRLELNKPISHGKIVECLKGDPKFNKTLNDFRDDRIGSGVVYSAIAISLDKILAKLNLPEKEKR